MQKLSFEDVDILAIENKCFLLGNICQLTASTSGIDTALKTLEVGQIEDLCCAHLWAPEGIVNPGVEVTLNYAVILEGPFSFPERYRRVSCVLFLWCSNPRQLQKELTLRLCHWADICKGKEHGLCFMKANHEQGSSDSRYNFSPLKRGIFDQESGSICLKDHFCLLCIAIDGSKGCASDRFYAALCHKDDKDFRICISYAVTSWKHVS